MTLVTTTEWRDIVKLQIRLEDEHTDTSWTHLRGKKMRTTAGFFDELSAALQFPVWAGENWDAVIDIVRDRAWLACTVIAIYDAHLLLIDATDADRRNFAKVMTLCNRDGKAEDASNVPADDTDGFHLLCQVPQSEKAAFTARWSAATLTMADL